MNITSLLFVPTPGKTFRHSATNAYIICVSSEVGGDCEMHWDTGKRERDELMIPKMVYAQDEFLKLINSKLEELVPLQLFLYK